MDKARRGRDLDAKTFSFAPVLGKAAKHPGRATRGRRRLSESPPRDLTVTGAVEGQTDSFRFKLTHYPSPAEVDDQPSRRFESSIDSPSETTARAFLLQVRLDQTPNRWIARPTAVRNRRHEMASSGDGWLRPWRSVSAAT